MAKISTLIDDFQDGVIDASKWQYTAGVVETGGRVKLTPSTSFPLFGSVFPRVHDLTNSQFVAHIPVVTSNGSTGTLQSGFAIEKDSNNYVGMRKLGSDLVCSKRVAGIETNLAFNLYSAVNHLFWRIRADASNIYFETSATGTGYFIQHTESIATLGFTINVVGVYFFSGYSGVEAFPGTFQIESVNPGLPITGSAASTSAGSLALTKTGPLPLTFSGASTSTGSLSMLAVSDLELTGSAQSTSAGSLAFTILLASTLPMSASGSSASSGSLAFTLITHPQLTASATSTSSGSFTYSLIIPDLPGGTWYFEPPVAYDLPPTLPEPTRPRYLNAHAKWKGGQRRGRSVLKHGNTYTIVDTPTVDQMAAADIAYQGGHVYEVTPEEAYYLHAAGFNVYHGTDLLTTEDGDFITTESGDLITVEYSFGSS